MVVVVVVVMIVAVTIVGMMIYLTFCHIFTLLRCTFNEFLRKFFLPDFVTAQKCIKLQ